MSQQVEFRRIRGRIVPIRKRKTAGQRRTEIAAGGAIFAGGAAAKRLSGAIERSEGFDLSRLAEVREKASFRPRQTRLLAKIMKKKWSAEDAAMASDYTGMTKRQVKAALTKQQRLKAAGVASLFDRREINKARRQEWKRAAEKMFKTRTEKSYQFFNQKQAQLDRSIARRQQIYKRSKHISRFVAGYGAHLLGSKVFRQIKRDAGEFETQAAGFAAAGAALGLDVSGIGKGASDRAVKAAQAQLFKHRKALKKLQRIIF